MSKFVKGKKYQVISDDSNNFKSGDVVTLIEDEDTDVPYFKKGKKEGYLMDREFTELPKPPKKKTPVLKVGMEVEILECIMGDTSHIGKTGTIKNLGATTDVFWSTGSCSATKVKPLSKRGRPKKVSNCACMSHVNGCSKKETKSVEKKCKFPHPVTIVCMGCIPSVENRSFFGDDFDIKLPPSPLSVSTSIEKKIRVEGEGRVLTLVEEKGNILEKFKPNLETIEDWKWYHKALGEILSNLGGGNESN